jgi:hypothetical protein
MTANQWNLINSEPSQIATMVGPFTITAAQLLALNTTPIVILPVPAVTTIVGAASPLQNVAYVIKSVSTKLNFGTTAFAGGTGLGLWYGATPTGSAIISIPPAAVTATASTLVLDIGPAVPTGYSVSPPTLAEGQQVILANSGTALTAGDGTLDVIVEYLILQT